MGRRGRAYVRPTSIPASWRPFAAALREAELSDLEDPCKLTAVLRRSPVADFLDAGPHDFYHVPPM